MSRIKVGRTLRTTTLSLVLFVMLAAAASAKVRSSVQCPSSPPAACSSIDDCAAQAYCNLKPQLKNGTNYWRLGNVFDTMTDFLFTFQKSDPDLATTALKTYNDTKSTSTCWYDDYAWWGIASSKAFDKRYDFIFDASTRSEFQKVAQDTWNIMNTGKNDGVHLGAPNVWTNKDNQSKFHPPAPSIPSGWAKPPRFAKGVWQYDIFYNARNSPKWYGPPECNGLTNPSRPDEIKLGPFQNTVVNGLYFVLALRLNTLAPNVPETRQAAQNEYSFLTSWFGNPYLSYKLPVNPGCMDCVNSGCGCSNDFSLLSYYGPNTALIRERVSTYAAEAGANPPYPPVNGWSKDMFWTGDQGLILGGLIDYLKLYPNDGGSSTVAKMIVNGVRAKMVDQNGAIVPWISKDNSAPGGDPDDYKSGSGVFMRYLLYGAQQPNSPIAGSVAGADFQGFLKKSVQSAMCAPQYDMFDSFNVLATLTAAKKLLKDQNVTASCQ